MDCNTAIQLLYPTWCSFPKTKNMQNVLEKYTPLPSCSKISPVNIFQITYAYSNRHEDTTSDVAVYKKICETNALTHLNANLAHIVHLRFLTNNFKYSCNGKFFSA